MAGSVSRGVLFSAPRFQDQQRVGHRGQRDVVMPARPGAPFKVIEAEFFRAFAVGLLDAPGPFRQPDEAPQAERFVRQLGHPVLDRRGLITQEGRPRAVSAARNSSLVPIARIGQDDA